MSAGATPEARAAAKKAAENRLVCVEEHAVGSNRKEKVCMTRKQMQARTAESKEQLRRGRSRGAETSQQGGVQ